MLSKWIVTIPFVAALALAGWTVASAAKPADETNRPETAAVDASPAKSADAQSETANDEGQPTRRRRGGRLGGWMARFEESTPAIGAPLPSIAAYDADGKAMNLADLKGSYAVVIFGCLT